MAGSTPDTSWTEETFRALTDQSADIISLLNANGELVFNSAAAARISGYMPDELRGVDTFELMHPEDQDAVRREFGNLLATPGGQITVQYRYRHKSGRWIWMEATATNQIDNPAVRGVVANSRDISARMALEAARQGVAEQLSRTRTLESLATLAGGVAHDFNNLLAVILGEAELLKVETLQSERDCALDSIASAARRAADLTSLLLAYAGRGRYPCEPVDLVSLLARHEPELQRLLGSGVRLSISVDGPVCSVEANESKLWQIIESLVANAAEAFERPSGEVRLKVGMVVLTEQELRTSHFEGQIEPGPAVYLEVTDTARGMESAVLQKIFEPFFSTKSTGRGLGLAAVAGLIRGFSGSLKVQSKLNEGSVFTLYFRPTEEPLAPPSQPPSLWCGSGLVLVIDDEPQIANVTARVLVSLGFTAAIATSGAAALELYGARQEEVRAVVLDMIMPTMDGTETFRRLRKLRPELPVLFYSGYPGDVARDELKATGTSFLQKPFSRELLGKTLQELLGER
jgi:PAS domain S-box-containing protein